MSNNVLNKDWIHNLKTNRNGEVILHPSSFKINSLENDDSKLWVEKNGYRKMFRGADNQTFVDGELLFSYLADALDVDSIHPTPAVLDNYKSYGFEGKQVSGMLVEDIVEDRKTTKLISVYGINRISGKENIKQHLKNLNAFQQKSATENIQVKIDYKKIQEQLTKLVFIDSLCYQVDRSDDNIHYTIKKIGENQYQVDLCKQFDNSLVFYFGYEYPQKYSFAKERKFAKFANALEKRYNNSFSFGDAERVDKNPSNIKELAKLINQDSEIKMFYQKAKAINFDEIAQRITKEKNGYQIPKERLKFAKRLWFYKLGVIEKEMNKQLTSQNTNQKEDIFGF